jgi:hypothetical protein
MLSSVVAPSSRPLFCSLIGVKSSFFPPFSILEILAAGASEDGPLIGLTVSICGEADVGEGERCLFAGGLMFG